MKKQLILASGSPRRREILLLAGFEFQIIPSAAQEETESYSAEALVMANAKAKAADIFAKNKNAVVLGADTVVALSGEILGKPKNASHAKQMLAALSGSSHSVLTGWCIKSAEGESTGVCETLVKFRELTEGEIDAYIATGEPLDKAGAYGIQEKGCLLAESVSGDFFNIIGLPISPIAKELENFGIEPNWK